MMVVDHLFAGIAVSDYARALPWYERVLGRPPEVVVADHEARWPVTPTGWIYVVADPDRAGRGLLTLLVDDLDAHLAAFTLRGLPAPAIETLPGVFRKAVLIDPDGNRVTFAQVAGVPAR